MGSTDPAVGTQPGGLRIHRSTVLRAVASVGVATVVAGVVWKTAPTRLEVPLDIVGYPTFYDFDFERHFLGYRLVVWVIPLVATMSYAVLRRWGPLRSPVARAAAAELVDHRAVGSAAVSVEVRGLALVRLLRLAPPALLVGLAVSAGSTSTHEGFTGPGILAAMAYVVVVVAAGLVVATLGWSTSDRMRAISIVNALAAALGAVWCLWHFTATTVVLRDNGHVDHWSWLPGWTAALFAFGALAGVAVALRRGVPVGRIETGVIAVLVGSVVLVFWTSVVPGPVGQLQGFDDMQSVTGADLLSRGYFPWRDFLFIHGVFEDVLRSSLGFARFEHTAWGAGAGSSMVWDPLGWVGLYLLAVWAVRRNWAALAAILGFLVVMSHVSPPSIRWFLAAYVFILLGEAIRRRTARWVVLLTVVLFIEAVLVPEAIYQVVAVAAVLLLVDLHHSSRDVSWWERLVRVRAFFASGFLLTLSWAVYLAANHALGSFVDYYLVFGPGHAASGSLPIGPFASVRFTLMFDVAIFIMCATFAFCVWRWIEGRPMSDRQWVAFAAAIMVGLYGEKALGRFDDGHIAQIVTVAMPLVVLWLAMILDSADDAVLTRTRSAFRRAALGNVRPIGALALVVVTCAQPSIISWTWAGSGNNKAQISASPLPRLGYAVPTTPNGAVIQDLRSVIDTLAGRHGEVFDFTNSPGIIYYLLGDQVPTKYYHVSMAIPEFSQEAVVRELRQRRPAVVVYDATQFGLARWDGPHNEVRHFIISDFLLDGWTPVVRTHGALLLLRNDLLVDRQPLPSLHEPAETTGLYTIPDGCNWGASAAYLESKPSGTPVDLAVGRPHRMRSIHVKGWAYDRVARAPARKILVAVGDTVVATIPTEVSRPDLVTAVGGPGIDQAGFDARITTEAHGRVSAYAVQAGGSVQSLSRLRGATRTAGTLTMPGGAEVRIDGVADKGALDMAGEQQSAQVSKVTAPPGTRLSSFDLATFSAGDHPIGRGDVMLMQGLVSSDTAESSGLVMEARDVAGTGPTLRVRVGSCLSWHGLQGDTLYLRQRGGQRIDHIRLSGVS